MVKRLGNVLPTQESLRAADEHYKHQLAAAKAKAKSALSGLQRRIVGGEERYYAGDTRYAIVGVHDQKIRWFKVTPEGDFPAN